MRAPQKLTPVNFWGANFQPSPEFTAPIKLTGVSFIGTRRNRLAWLSFSETSPCRHIAVTIEGEDIPMMNAGISLVDDPLLGGEGQSDDRRLFSIPSDLTEWVPANVLLEWTGEEIAALDWNHPDLVAYLETHREYKPRMLLGLLSYAYATGLYSTEDIISACYGNTPLRFLSNGEPPTAKSLLRFRRENRGLFKWILVQLFKRALKAKFPELPLLAGLKKHLVESATLRLQAARHMDREGHGP